MSLSAAESRAVEVAWITGPDDEPPIGLPAGLLAGPGSFTRRHAPSQDFTGGQDPADGQDPSYGQDAVREENIASYGSLAAPPFLRLVLARGEPARQPAFFRDIARRAAETGIAVVRLSRSSGLPTRLGSFEVADAAFDDGFSRVSACQVFRFHHADLEFGLSGWLCDDGPDSGRNIRLACLIDHLGLSPRASDLPLRVAFAEAGQIASSECADTRAGRSAGPPAETVADMSAAAPIPIQTRAKPSAAHRRGTPRRTRRTGRITRPARLVNAI